MKNKELLNWLKEIYIKAKTKNFNWKNIYPNNMLCNGVEGIYVDMFFKNNNKYTYIKYSIQYMSRCDANGISHPAEGIKYYVLHELRINDLDDTFEISRPSNNFNWEDNLSCLVNDYGRFRYVFDDEETAKEVVSKELLGIIYPYQYLLDDKELEEWNNFIKEQNEKENNKCGQE